eukprot:SM000059S18690  [mRNA]  locus=s59:388939:393964:+ [translate_table: standard]
MADLSRAALPARGTPRAASAPVILCRVLSLLSGSAAATTRCDVSVDDIGTADWRSPQLRRSLPWPRADVKESTSFWSRRLGKASGEGEGEEDEEPDASLSPKERRRREKLREKALLLQKLKELEEETKGEAGAGEGQEPTKVDADAVEEFKDAAGEADVGKAKDSGSVLRSDGSSGSSGKAPDGVRNIIVEGKPLLPELKRSIWEKPPPNTPVPPAEEFALRREMVEFRADRNVVVVSFANHAFLDFVETFVRHLTDVKVFNILIGAMDDKLLESLFYLGIPGFDMKSHMMTGDAGWGTQEFHKMGREKVVIVNAFLSMGYELLMCDTDIIWLQNPLPYFQRWPMADVFTSSDHLQNTVDNDSLEDYLQAGSPYNIGILHFRPTEESKRFAKEWNDLIVNDNKIWDQNGFNDLMRKKFGPAVENGRGIFYAYDGTLKVGILPVSIFCSGHTYFIQHLYQYFGLKPYAFHATFQFAGTEGKRHRFREAKEFFDKPEYYNVPEGFLHYQSDIPDELMTGGVHSVETHFNLVNYQVRNALAISQILNRTLIMPELWCRFDRVWYPHDGILIGTRMKQPFLCPMDHIFEVLPELWSHLDKGWFAHPGVFEGTRTPQPFLSPLDYIFELPNMLKEMPGEGYGPVIPFREYSFLDNPRTPAAVLESKLDIKLCDKKSAKCPSSPRKTGVAAAGSTLHLPKLSTENEIATALEPFRSLKLLEFSSMTDAFGGWDDKARQEGFEKRVWRYPGIWCCVNAPIGHIYYDMFWDRTPGWKPRHPTGNEDNHPPWVGH